MTLAMVSPLTTDNSSMHMVLPSRIKAICNRSQRMSTLPQKRQSPGALQVSMSTPFEKLDFWPTPFGDKTPQSPSVLRLLISRMVCTFLFRKLEVKRYPFWLNRDTPLQVVRIGGDFAWRCFSQRWPLLNALHWTRPRTGMELTATERYCSTPIPSLMNVFIQLNQLPMELSSPLLWMILERILSADETVHPSDEDTDISDFLQQTSAVRKQDAQEPTVKQCRPNHDLIVDRDDIIPYERRFHNGDHFLGRTIPPPNWRSQPVVRQAANVGAVRRDGDGQPFVYFRTWLLLHEGQSPRVSRNLEIRAQLVVQLSARIKNLWSDLVGTFDAIRVTIVTPTPAREGDDDTRIHVLVERNRPIVSTLRPILLSFQQITREGLSTAIEWYPLLAPSVITLPYLQQTCQLPCELHHLLVPLAPTHRGWMAPHQQRHIVPGNYIPGWWDMRRQPPGPEEGVDDNSHLQVSTVRACGTLSYPHVSDLWCDNTVFHTLAQHVDMTHQEIPHDISDGNDALILMQRGAIKKRRTTESSPSTTPIVQAFHVYRLSTTYELVPAPPPEQGSDVPGHILRLISTHLGFEATEPARCHPISATIQGMMALPAFIYEHNGDSFSQQYTDDILALVDITIRGQDNTEHKIRRVLWLRTASTRSALLNTLRCGDICEVMNPPCRVFLNNGFWPELDSVRRHFDFGDYVEIFIEADKPVEETLSCLRIAEISDRKRRIFLDTPPPDSPSQGDDPDRDNWESTSDEQPSEPRDDGVDKGQGTKNSTTRVAIELQSLIAPPCWVRVNYQQVQDLRTRLLMFQIGPVDPTIAKVVKWHDATIDAFATTPLWTNEEVLHYQLFTDGSSYRQVTDDGEGTRIGAAAVVLIVSTPEGDRFGGSLTFSLDHSPTAPQTEIAAVTLALLWIKDLAQQHDHYNHYFQATIGFDCMTAGKASEGQWKIIANQESQTTNRALTQWIQQLYGPWSVQWRHISSHQGHAWNEAADALAWAAVHQWINTEEFQPVRDLFDDSASDLHAASWLWFLEASLQGSLQVPRNDGSNFLVDIAAPLAHRADPAIQPIAIRCQQDAHDGARKAFDFSLRCATANVLTLYGKEDSKGAFISARQESLLRQTQQQSVHVAGIQETRSAADGHANAEGYHILSSPASTKGVGGIQLWVAAKWKFEQFSIDIAVHHLRIVHSTTQRMIVALDNPGMRLLFVVAHAPACESSETIRKFWSSMTGPRYTYWMPMRGSDPLHPQV